MARRSPFRKRLDAYLVATTSPLTSAALVLPLLVFYGLGTIVAPAARNGVDMFSVGLAALFVALGATESTADLYYAGFYGSMALINVGLVAWLRNKRVLEGRVFLPLLFESAVYAIAVGTVSAQLTDSVLRTMPFASMSLAPFAALPASFADVFAPLADAAKNEPQGFSPGVGVVVSAGAGLHEEFVFRLIGVGAIARLWLGPEWRRQLPRLLFIIAVSSILFAAVHHVFEPFLLERFIYRAIAGAVFAGLFLARGFAVAAWTHALYDVWVIVILGA